MTPLANAQIRLRLLRWYDAHRRDLPWRVRPGSPKTDLPDPWRVLVSEFMLQQTQVATVIPYFNRFLDRFPTADHLAAASIDQVLQLWQGLGYYSRARNLHAAARAIVGDHAGVIPSDPDALLTLPGVGQYTAGAVASIAFARRTPLVDGNVARVISRINAWADDPKLPANAQRIWSFCHDLVPKKRPGDFNASLMELGATVCTPRSPDCPACPLLSFCRAYAQGLQNSIPPARTRPKTRMESRWVFCLHHRGRYLLEQRPPTGRWAGLWQFVTLIADPDSTPQSAAKSLAPSSRSLTEIADFNHQLSHRIYRFQAFAASAATRTIRHAKPDVGGLPVKAGGASATSKTSRPVDPTSSQSTGPVLTRKWFPLKDLPNIALSRPHRKIADLLTNSA